MNRSGSPVCFLAMVVVFAVILGVGRPATGAHAQAPANDAERPYPPPLLQPGQPLPGTGYPWQRVTRSAPTGKAPTAPPAGIDLDVTYIQREPTYLAYCVQYPGGIPTLCPGTEGEQRWPAPGEVVTFTAHIVNKGTLGSPPFGYEWTIDGVEVLSGTLPALAPAAEIAVSYRWPWAHTMDGERVVGDHTVGFRADPDCLVAETYEINNSLEDRTNALGFRLAITPAMYNAYNTPWNPALSYSAEDWLQRQIAAMNGAFAGSTYPTTPGGATERVRINAIVVTAVPPAWDRTSDGGWFVDADYRLVSGGYDPATDVDWNLVHELSHQVGLIDLYNLNISTTSVKVLDRDGGATNFGFSWPHPDLMGGGDIDPHTDPHLYSSHSAGGISATKGYRRGYYGEYQFDIPEQNYLLVLDSLGNPAQDVQVAVYQRNGPPNWMGELGLDNTPEITGITDAGGRSLLANRPVGVGVTTRTGHILHDNPFGVVDVVGGQNRFLIKLSKGSHEEFAWTDITDFNLAFWQGDTISHTFVLSSHVPPPGAPAPPAGTTAQVEGEQATLCWEASPSAEVIGYYVYRAAPPTYEYERASSLVTGLCCAQAYGATRIYTVTAADSAGRESAFSNAAWAPRLINPYAVGLMSDGLRTVLDPQNGYALLRQRADGRYVQNVGSVHYHLEQSLYMAVDGLDRLLFSHPGDWYTGRHSVRVADRDANPVLEFGEQGSGPGQFETPAGLATVGQPAHVGGPYEVDAHTLLLLHWNGSYEGAQGEAGTPSGTTFEAGKYDQGVTIDAADTLTYGTAGNLARSQGAIEFWLRPSWNGGDYVSHTFFEVGDGWFNRIRIMKDGANNLQFIVWDADTEYRVAYNVAYWQAGEWHHVAATWEGTSITLFVDGQQRDRSDAASPPETLANTIHIGSSLWHDQQADATLDELRISDVPRIGDSGAIPYRILVVDSVNDRLQAFDELGNFVSAYGGPGSGPGHFQDPQGLAVDGEGRVIVADTGNNRLQVLGFDGNNWRYIGSITAGFLAPTGVAAGADGRIVVGDTGNNRVVVFGRAGNLLAAYTEPNDGHTGAFNQPHGVGWTPSGEIVVADTGNQRVVTIVPIQPEHRLYTPLILKGYFQSSTSCQELVQNGGFEDGTAWVVGSTPRPARYTSDQAHSGERSVLLGLVPGESDIRSYSSVRQSVTVPAGTYSTTLTFWSYPVSGLDGGDRQECLLLDEQDKLLAILMRTNDNTAAWTEVSYDLSAYAGQTVSLYFNAYNDGDDEGVTGFYLDDVSVKSCAIPGPPPPPPCYPALRASVEVGQMPHGVAVNSAARRVYVANHGDNTLSAVNGETYELVGTVAVGDGPNGVAYSPASDMIYVANRNANAVMVLRASDYGLVKTVGVGSQPDGLAVNAASNRIYVANYGSGTVSMIDGATNSVIQNLAVGAEPAMVAVNPLTDKAYVSLHGAGRVAVIDGTGNVSQVDISSAGPYGIAVDTLRDLVYVATIDTARIAVIDGSTDTLLGWAEIRRLPGGEAVPLRMIAVNPSAGTSGHVFVTTAGEDLGWNKLLMFPHGWPESFGRPYGLELGEPREGIAFDPGTLRVLATSRRDDTLAVYLDGEPACPGNVELPGEYQIVVCVANADGSCQERLSR
jgi:YVTN family beta-propeller protein